MAEEKNTAQGNNGKAAEQPQQSLHIMKVYVKDVSFEAPSAPAAFRGEWRPEVNVELGSASRRLDENNYEVELTSTVTVKNAENTAYVCEVKQAGVFRVTGFGDRDVHTVLGAYCPAQLFPFLREAVSDLVVKGGFPQLLLAPVNFEALYLQQQQKRQQEQGAAAESAADAGER